MSVINPDGLFHGDRLRMCSDMAQLHFPRFFFAANGFGRMEINYARIIGTAYQSFAALPSEEEVQGYLIEYEENWLLFAYEHNGQLWAEWDTPPGLLSDYKTAKDKKSPAPPAGELNSWKRLYRSDSRSFGKYSGKIREKFPSYRPRKGNGVGIGSGLGVGGEVSPQNSTGLEEARSSAPEKPKPGGEKKLALIPVMPTDFAAFRAIAEDAGMSAGNPEWESARVIKWNHLDFEQQLEAVKGIRARKGTNDPVLNATPMNYLGNQLWGRRIWKPGDRGSPAGKAELTADLLTKRLREEAEKHGTNY